MLVFISGWVFQVRVISVFVSLAIPDGLTFLYDPRELWQKTLVTIREDPSTIPIV